MRNREEVERHCDQLSLRLGRVLQTQLERLSLRFTNLERRLISPQESLRRHRQKLHDLEQRLQRALLWKLESYQRRLQQASEGLNALSPLQVLARGYALARLYPGGTPLYDVKQVKVGDLFSVQLGHGQLQACVTKTLAEKKVKEA